MSTIDPYDRTPNPLLVVISGPSGVGKDMTIQGLKERGQNFYFVVTATTRPKRPNEVHGIDYFFISMSEFAEMIDQDELLEYAVVYGDYKGIPKAQVREALSTGQDVIMRIDVQGAATMRELVPDAVLIYLSAESEEALIRRLRERKTEPEDQLRMRIATARQEMKRLDDFDFVVINADDELEKTIDAIEAIILSEKSRVNQRQITL